jgi:hypothetical protein
VEQIGRYRLRERPLHIGRLLDQVGNPSLALEFRRRFRPNAGQFFGCLRQRLAGDRLQFVGSGHIKFFANRFRQGAVSPQPWKCFFLRQLAIDLTELQTLRGSAPEFALPAR